MSHDDNPFDEIAERDAFYEPVVDWCHSFHSPAGDSRNVIAEFYAALEPIVRHERLNLRDLRLILVRQRWTDPAEPQIAAEVDQHWRRAWVVRE
jgi:hypothetical protein